MQSGQAIQERIIEVKEEQDAYFKGISMDMWRKKVLHLELIHPVQTQQMESTPEAIIWYY
jgi:hypothetical protein